MILMMIIEPDKNDTAAVEFYSVGVNAARTMIILMIVFQELLRAHTSRSLRVSIFEMGLFSNIYMHISVMVAVIATLIFALIPGLQSVFDMEDLEGREWGLIIGMSFLPAVVDELTKIAYRITGFGERPKAVRYSMKAGATGSAAVADGDGGSIVKVEMASTK